MTCFTNFSCDAFVIVLKRIVPKVFLTMKNKIYCWLFRSRPKYHFNWNRPFFLKRTYLEPVWKIKRKKAYTSLRRKLKTQVSSFDIHRENNWGIKYKPSFCQRKLLPWKRLRWINGAKFSELEENKMKLQKSLSWISSIVAVNFVHLKILNRGLLKSVVHSTRTINILNE